MRKRPLSPEDEALWREVARSVKPIRKRTKKAADAAETASRPAIAPARKIAAVAPPAAPASGRKEAAAAPSAPKRASKPLSPLSAGDPALDRKARRGCIAIERDVDLHGMTQARAEALLLRFLEDARADGVRCVRVITGKGAREGGGRGVLRRRFLDWIEAAPFRPLIARVASAEPRADTPGAYFVFLKSRRP